MNRTKTLGLILLLTALLLTGCSTEALIERGAGLLDAIFAGDSVNPIAPSADREPDAEPDSEPGTEPAQEPDTGPVAEEPVISDPAEPAVPSHSGEQPPAQPEQNKTEQTKPEQTGQEQEKSKDAPSSEEVTPSHTDITFFGPGESVRYLPKGVTGTYACDYATGNPKVASVDTGTGKITAVGPGTTKVTMHVESNGQYDFACIVRCNWTEDEDQTGSAKKDSEPVLPPEPSTPSAPSTSSAPSGGTVSASHSDATFFNPKESFRLYPTGVEDGYTTSYTTSDSDVAAVDAKTGVVTAAGPGTATVTMTVDCGGTEYIFECIVRCNW